MDYFHQIACTRHRMDIILGVGNNISPVSKNFRLRLAISRRTLSFKGKLEECLCPDLSSTDVGGMTHINAKTTIACDFFVLSNGFSDCIRPCKPGNLTVEMHREDVHAE